MTYTLLVYVFCKSFEPEIVLQFKTKQFNVRNLYIDRQMVA